MSKRSSVSSDATLSKKPSTSAEVLASAVERHLLSPPRQSRWAFAGCCKTVHSSNSVLNQVRLGSGTEMEWAEAS
eukprot:1157419-Pelagomonas_calceolata.AAC.18